MTEETKRRLSAKFEAAIGSMRCPECGRRGTMVTETTGTRRVVECAEKDCSFREETRRIMF
jgi:hypothetical protein